MKRFAVKYTMAVPILLLLACGRHSAKVSDPLPVAQMRLVFQQAFQNADSATREAATKIVGEAEQHQAAAAYDDVRELAAQPTLTEDQRITAIRAETTISQLTQEAAQSGDTQAAETLHHARATH